MLPLSALRVHRKDKNINIIKGEARTCIAEEGCNNYTSRFYIKDILMK